MLTDLMLVTSRASHSFREVWDMSSSSICLLLSKFAPATARLFAEFRRLRDSLPPAKASTLAEGMEGGGQLITLTQVCLHACYVSRTPRPCSAPEQKWAGPQSPVRRAAGHMARVLLLRHVLQAASNMLWQPLFRPVTPGLDHTDAGGPHADRVPVGHPKNRVAGRSAPAALRA